MKSFLSSFIARLTSATRSTQMAPANGNTLVLQQGAASAPVSEANKRVRKTRDTTDYKTGDEVVGTISGIEHYGIFIRLPNGESGLVFHSEINWPGEDNQHEIGDTVTVLVTGFKPGRGLALSLREVRVKASFDAFAANYPAGSTFDGTIKSVLDFGVFVHLTPGVSGLLHVSSIPNIKAYGRETIGQPITVRVVNVDLATRRITLELP